MALCCAAGPLVTLPHHCFGTLLLVTLKAFLELVLPGALWGAECRILGGGTLFSAVAALLHFSPIPWLWLRDSLSPHIPTPGHPSSPHQLTWLPFQPSASHVVGAQAGLGRLEAGCSHSSLPCWAKYG